jgi:hypothetical protein
VAIQNASPTVSHNLITGNQADMGGGVSVHGGSPRISGNVITGNTSGGIQGIAGGGGIMIWPSSSPVVMDNVIVNNTGANGGAGGLSVAGSADVHNNTIVGNYSGPARGALVIAGGSPVFTNNIVSNEASIEQTGGTPSFNYNDYRFGSPSTPAFNIPAGSVGNVSYPTFFLNPPGGDYHLSPNSALADIGTASVLLPRETDMDGEPRLMGTGVDLGADETSVPFTEGDAALALAIAGGTKSATPADALRFDWVDPIGVDVNDAALLARRVAGLEPNP